MTTLAAFVPRYLAFAGRTLTPRGLEQYQSLLDRHILPLLGDKELCSLSTASLWDLQDRLSSTPHQANKATILVRRVVKVAALLGEPCAAPEKPPPLKVSKPERYLSSAERLRLKAVLAADLSMSARVVELCLLTGCRKGEILALRWDEVDFERGMFRLRKSKTGPSTRVVSQEALELLMGLPQASEWVFPSIGGHQRGIQKAWERIRLAADLRSFRLHDLRHSFASHGIASGLSLPVVGALLGHKSVSSTARYAHLDQNLLREALRRMG